MLYTSELFNWERDYLISGDGSPLARYWAKIGPDIRAAELRKKDHENARSKVMVRRTY